MESFAPSSTYTMMPELVPFITGLPEIIAGIASCAGATYTNGYYVVDCNNIDAIPDLEISGIPISSDMLVTKIENRCILAVDTQLSNGFGPDIYLGIPLFKQYCVFFEYERKMIGLGNVKGATTRPSPTLR
ncbi:unnamed protein product [Cylicostephanus goldi]|uniref:Peptidase A1 domain-containing protein n=1 Tax=Cylicostephanus goldi TaxID=71465 RepID=A0A3P7MRA1_CYLGO|nr:unnamed protein product [Cylicostephanus goldi]